MKDRVTIGFYSKEISASPGFTQDFISELENIRNIRNGLVQAAQDAKREPPEIILSVLLVPNWDRADNSYQDSKYQEVKAVFLEKVKLVFEGRNINGDTVGGVKDVAVQDFYTECKITASEMAYMENLRATGSNADIIKTRAIINNLNRRHLQIDTNTIIPSFSELYNHTFNAVTQKDGLNASYYDEFYITAHNKMVYTTPSGKIATKSHLEEIFTKWCEDHKNDSADKLPKKNSIYARVFTSALSEIGYTKRYLLTKSGKELFPSTLSPDVYWLTHTMVTALNKTWSDDKEPPESKRLKLLPAIHIGENAIFNYPSFVNVIKKYTGNLRRHSIMLGIKDDSLQGDESRKLLLTISSKLEKQAIRDFYVQSTYLYPLEAFILANTFPASKLGDKLTNDLFKMTVKQLQDEAKILTDVAIEVFNAHFENASQKLIELNIDEKTTNIVSPQPSATGGNPYGRFQSQGTEVLSQESEQQLVQTQASNIQLPTESNSHEQDETDLERQEISLHKFK